MKFEANETTSLLLQVLGYQGGTIHQAAQETGLSTSQILDLHNTKHEHGLLSDESKGFSCILTNSLVFNKANIFINNKGNPNFWFGACRARRYINQRDRTVTSL